MTQSKVCVIKRQIPATPTGKRLPATKKDRKLSVREGKWFSHGKACHMYTQSTVDTDRPKAHMLGT